MGKAFKFIQYLNSLKREGHNMWPSHFHAFSGYGPYSFVQIKLIPSGLNHFACSYECEHQKFNGKARMEIQLRIILFQSRQKIRKVTAVYCCEMFCFCRF